MLSIATKIFGLFKIHIVHSIPGRLRVQVPLLARVSEELFHEHKERLNELIMLKRGIKEITVSYHTNKILFLYDDAQISASQIIDWLNHIWEEAIAFYSRFKHLPLNELDSRQEEIFTEFKLELKKKEELL